MKIMIDVRSIANKRFFTILLSEVLEKCLVNGNCTEKTGGVGKHTGLSRGVFGA